MCVCVCVCYYSLFLHCSFYMILSGHDHYKILQNISHKLCQFSIQQVPEDGSELPVNEGADNEMRK